MKNLDIKGRRQIQAWEQTFDDGRVTYPIGTELEGLMEYGPNGTFCAITKKDRAQFTTGGQWDASDAEKVLAYNTYLIYAGNWSIEGNVVKHAVKHRLLPNCVGGEQKRYAEQKGDLLSLTKHKLGAGTSEARVARLTFKRV
jgi:hypothetical protein